MAYLNRSIDLQHQTVATYAASGAYAQASWAAGQVSSLKTTLADCAEVRRQPESTTDTTFVDPRRRNPHVSR